MKYKYIIFDFDGVIAETNEIRFDGFRLLFNDYEKALVDQVVKFARQNGGLSRYEKIRYFFETVLAQSISEEKVTALSMEYSNLIIQRVVNASFVKGTIDFIRNNKDKYDYAIASGADQRELREVCKLRGINTHFVDILGSPVSKETNIANLLKENNWDKQLCLFVGDTLNDLDASRANEIDFIGRSSGLVDWNSVDDVPFIADLSSLHNYLVNSFN